MGRQEESLTDTKGIEASGSNMYSICYKQFLSYHSISSGCMDARDAANEV